MKPQLPARVVLAVDVGYAIASTPFSLPDGYTLIDRTAFMAPPYLAPPAERIPVVAVDGARYSGEILGILVGDDWRRLDATRRTIPQTPAASPPERDSHRFTYTSGDGPGVSDEAEGLVIEETYRTGRQLHALRAPLWVQAITGKDGGIELVLPTQWPAHVAQSVSGALDIPRNRITVIPLPHGVLRDAAAILPSQLAVLAALAATTLRRSVLLSTTIQENFLTGGRPASRSTITLESGEDGRITRLHEAFHVDTGAYGTFGDEAEMRFSVSPAALYRGERFSGSCDVETSTAVPSHLFEGLHDPQRNFAREMHINHLSATLRRDPVLWRLANLATDDGPAAAVCEAAARSSDFHRHYGANETRNGTARSPAPDDYSTRGIGFALAHQQSGLVSRKSVGTVGVRLEQDGAAVLRCSLPTANDTLKMHWRRLVADRLDIAVEDVLIDDQFHESRGDSGPAILSRSVSLVPRTIALACDAIGRQRFRKPLPLEVVRTIRIPQAKRYAADQGISYGAAAVEVLYHPATLELDIRTVHLAIHGGQIVDKQAAERELRRGIYQALGWTLHEGVAPGTRERDLSESGLYETRFRGRLPRIRITLLPSDGREGSAGIGELPFSTIPAATAAALTQATGVPFREIPLSIDSILKEREQ